MAKGDELWDDSALVNAFNDAMSKYKVKMFNESNSSFKIFQKYHGKNGHGSSADSREVQADSGDREVEETSKDISQPTAELLDGDKIGPLDENHFAQSHGHEQTLDSTNALNAQASSGYYSEQDTEAYNQLLSQYYELEEKRQTILQQLGYSYQQPAEGSTSQDQSVPVTEPYLATCNCYSCPYASNCPVASCSAVPACSWGAECGSKLGTDSATLTCCGKPGSFMENDMVKTAIEAASRAISSVKEKALDSNSVKDGDDKGLVQEAGSETDLSAVLNAWFSAGFHTAKYLTEQSMAKK
ncbi:hypothetical protein LINPERPRIM_LOCUS10219 [Linum perenne]